MHANSIFSACPHDVILDPEKWQALVDYLSAKKAFVGGFERHGSFTEFAENFSRFGLVYAHPLHVTDLVMKFGFTPIARYDDVYDEAVVITRRNHPNPSFESVAEGSVALVNGSPSHAAFLIDASEKKIPITYDPVLKDNYQDVLMDVALNIAEYGIILKSVWDEMLVMKDRVRPFHATATKKLVHGFAVSPELKERASAIEHALLHMHEDEAGQAILRRLQCKKMVPFRRQDVEKLQADLSVCVFEQA
jgi:ABC transporter, phosphonate, periplasmic substrate-binding protein